MNRLTRSAFSLIEVLILVVIIGIIAAVAIPKIVAYRNQPTTSFQTADGTKTYEGCYMRVHVRPNTPESQMFNAKIYKIGKVSEHDVQFYAPGADHPIPYTRSQIADVEKRTYDLTPVVMENSIHYNQARADFGKADDEARTASKP